jgi:uncharacterized phage infection (PIP) family protein YhgE
LVEWGESIEESLSDVQQQVADMRREYTETTRKISRQLTDLQESITGGATDAHTHER